MKKLLIILSLLALTGCSSKQLLKDPKTLYEYKNQKVSEEDILESILKLNSGLNIIQDVETKVLEELKNEMKYDLTDRINEEYQEFVKYAESMNTKIEDFMQYYGFTSVEDFKAYIGRTVFMETYTKDKVKENLEDLVKKYGLKNVGAFKVDTKETADKVLEFAKTGPFDDIKKEFELKNSTTFVYTNDSQDLTENQLKELKSLKASQGYIEDDGKGTIIVYIVNPLELTEEQQIDAITNNTTYSQDVFIGEIHKRGFKVHNSIIKDQIKKENPKYLGK